MPFSIIIPSRNAANLTECISAIRKSGCSARIEVIDDADDESVWKVCEDFHVWRTVGKKPFCFAANVNIGIGRAANFEPHPAEDVLIMNDDALVQSSPDEMWLASRKVSHVGILSASVIGPSNSHEHAPREGTHIREIAGKMVPFICVLIPRRTINAVGLLEERFCGVYGGEDDDYCYRVRKAGLRIGVYDGCVVDHGTLKSTYRPDGKGLPIAATKARFREIHGFDMGTR